MQITPPGTIQLIGENNAAPERKYVANSCNAIQNQAKQAKVQKTLD